ncbi:MAG: DedA family protein [Leptolyngbyaceae cyanobacterium SM1_1_3]|nr:DedA family protein [Leptolyngbyaceae cyanobacterium SM1_1_3]NJM85109.1 DedA family protein [Leptolyngbyaceae cyanobacterium RM2_2_21]NJN02830.1 DedA family protein [Leptolyngbyaceae cyanobacterium RM1_1_2]NJO11601.1 DedA family protein [Leptolyngbyaceae cyanobacterium SL_1_1]
MTSEIVSLEAIQAIAHQYGYWAVFLGILLENTGIPIPGETVTLVGGFLAGEKELRYWYVLACAIAGAVLGDNFGYWIGFYGGWPLLTRLGKLFRIEETKLIRVREEFSKNAVKAVILGRFVALLRIFAGPLAGIARMPYPKFLVCNLIGAATWASIMVSLAYFVGQVIPLSVLVHWTAQFAVLGLLAVLAWLGTAWWLEQRQQTAEVTQSKE